MMNPSLSELRRDLDRVTEDVGGTFLQMSDGQINWKPSAESWSVGQVFDHLIAANEGMIGVIEGKIDGTSPPTFYERLPLLPRLFGSLIGGAVSPGGRRKIKAPKVFEPAASDIDAGVIDRFLALQPKVASTMERCKDPEIIMGSPAAAVITYSLLNAFTIVVRHEQRHVLQAKRVMAADGFPN